MTPRSVLFMPPASLSACLFGGIYRDTCGADLGAEERLNHFPASPLVVLTFVARGRLEMITDVTTGAVLPEPELLPEMFVIGPTQHPTTSRALGEVAAISIGMYYDAWRALAGGPDDALVPPALAQPLSQLTAHDDLEQGWLDFCAALEPAWAKMRAPKQSGVQNIADWAHLVAMRAAMSKPGQSLRTLERGLRKLSGQNRQALDFFAHMEQLHKTYAHNVGSAPADIALQAGYADQSHMGRAVRRATGFSPAKLNKAIQNEEAFWCYRLLGERF